MTWPMWVSYITINHCRDQLDTHDLEIEVWQSWHCQSKPTDEVDTNVGKSLHGPCTIQWNPLMLLWRTKNSKKSATWTKKIPESTPKELNRHPKRSKTSQLVSQVVWQCTAFDVLGDKIIWFSGTVWRFHYFCIQSNWFYWTIHSWCKLWSESPIQAYSDIITPHEHVVVISHTAGCQWRDGCVTVSHKLDSIDDPDQSSSGLWSSDLKAVVLQAWGPIPGWSHLTCSLPC